MASSSDSEHRKTRGSNWTIDMNAYAKTEVKLQTEINDSRSGSQICRAYCRDNATTSTITPWNTQGKSIRGINPLHGFLFEPCAAEDEGAQPAANKTVKYTTEAQALVTEITDSGYMASTAETYGKEPGNCIPSYQQILNYPTQSFNSFRQMISDHIENEPVSSNPSKTRD